MQTSQPADRPGRILVTPRSLTAHGLDTIVELDGLRAAGYELVGSRAGRTPGEEELLRLVPDVVGWLAGVEQIGARVLARAPKLKAISRNGAGVDNIDAGAAHREGIAVLRAPGANAQGVAELAVGLCLTALRDLSASAQAVREGRWGSGDRCNGGWARTPGRELSEVTVGVVGLGAVGRRSAAVFSSLGASVVAYDPFVEQSEFELTMFDDLMDRADVVTLHCPPQSNATALVDRAALQRLKSGAILINTARSGLVDDDAALDALNAGQLSFYAVDAFDREPPEPSTLLAHPRVFATPHLGGYTHASVSKAARAAADNLLDALSAR